MDFLRIAGNEEILNDWVEYLTQCNLIRAETSEEDGKTYYVKTEFGQRLHEILKYYYLCPLFGDLK
jgi:hypothetical protein